MCCCVACVSALRRLGTYELSYEPTRKGRHTVRVELHGQHIRGSPFHFKLEPGAPVGSKSVFRQKTEPAIVGAPCTLVLETVDKYGNSVEKGGATINARAIGTGVSSCNVVDEKDGTYSIEFTSSVVGDAKV